MLELLKQFEENTMDDAIMGPDNDDDDDDEGDGVDLAERLGGLDIESASYDQIWDALTPAEHEKFKKALGDPTSDMAQQLLASDELGNSRKVARPPIDQVFYKPRRSAQNLSLWLYPRLWSHHPSLERRLSCCTTSVRYV